MTHFPLSSNQNGKGHFPNVSSENKYNRMLHFCIILGKIKNIQFIIFLLISSNFYPERRSFPWPLVAVYYGKIYPKEQATNLPTKWYTNRNFSCLFTWCNILFEVPGNFRNAYDTNIEPILRKTSYSIRSRTSSVSNFLIEMTGPKTSSATSDMSVVTSVKMVGLYCRSPM